MWNCENGNPTLLKKKYFATHHWSTDRLDIRSANFYGCCFLYSKLMILLTITIYGQMSVSVNKGFVFCFIDVSRLYVNNVKLRTRKYQFFTFIITLSFFWLSLAHVHALAHTLTHNCVNKIIINFLYNYTYIVFHLTHVCRNSLYHKKFII